MTMMMTRPQDSTVAGRLFVARVRAGERRGREISKAAVARYLHLSPQSYQAYEDGSARPSYENMLRLARLFGVDVLWLMFGDQAVQAPPRSSELLEDLGAVIATEEEAARQPTGRPRRGGRGGLGHAT